MHGYDLHATLAETKQSTQSVIAPHSALISFVRKTTSLVDTFQALNGFADQKMHFQLTGATEHLVGTAEKLTVAACYSYENVFFAIIQKLGV